MSASPIVQQPVAQLRDRDRLLRKPACREGCAATGPPFSGNSANRSAPSRPPPCCPNPRSPGEGGSRARSANRALINSCSPIAPPSPALCGCDPSSRTRTAHCQWAATLLWIASSLSWALANVEMTDGSRSDQWCSSLLHNYDRCLVIAVPGYATAKTMSGEQAE